ncbi:Short-chain dehydrogenase/reductase family protein [Mycena indigotica]|uniref:Short-chain dehydrogenase/reductase family protein n=1 Tax=Mycena indigotica TaxID=2126181 RepID=A0A8H6TF94_9AGAR|nr:Short-chain dehydrogenase/reductase family protein [Mycena indigotica]KAF7315682.1 Short-chain dehydrogenase/reductase family protein [Mycena indigotica]
MASLRSILVTGANQGLGFHTVQQLAQTENTLVFMGSRKLSNAKQAITKFVSEIHPSSLVVPVQLDITDEESIRSATGTVETALKERKLAGLDVLVNNAAVATQSFQEVYAVNVTGTAAITAALRPLLNKNGAIINMSSSLASHAWHTKRPPPPIESPAYSSSKSALNHLTLIWAIEEEQRGHGVRVVSICPGFNATKLSDYMGTIPPSEGARIIVKTALEEGGQSGVYFNKEGLIEW